MQLKVLNKNKFNALVYILFIVVIIPYLTYTYSVTVPMLYASNVIIPILIMCAFALFKLRYKYDDYSTFLPFLVFITFQAIIFNHNNITEVVKYILFFVIYAFVFKPYFKFKKIYTTYVNFIVWISLFSLFFYILNFFIDFSCFEIKDIKIFLSDKSALLTRDWGYQIPLYFFVDSFGQGDGILGLPRLFGISHEPTAFAAFVMPTILLAYHLKKVYSAIILFIILLLVSSYGAFIFFMLSLLLIYGYKHPMYAVLLFCIICMAIYIGMDFNASRINLYLGIFDNYFSQDIDYIATKSFEPIINKDDVNSIDVPAVLNLSLSYGIIASLLYLYIVIKYVSRVLEMKDQILLGFLVGFLLMLNKSQLLFSPLFFFYLSYIDFNLRKFTK